MIRNSTLAAAAATGLAAAGMALVLGATSAAAATFNLGGSGGNIGNPSATFDDTTGTVSLTAIAINTQQPPTPRLHQNGFGLGVNLGFGDINQLDNIGDDEAIVFDFGIQSVFTSISLTLASFDDDYRIYGTDNAAVASCTSGGLSCLTTGSTLLAFGSGSGIGGGAFVDLTGSAPFRFLIATTPGGSGDGYRVSQIVASPVPLPAAGWMLLAGVGGIVAMKRRRKAA